MGNSKKLKKNWRAFRPKDSSIFSLQSINTNQLTLWFVDWWRREGWWEKNEFGWLSFGGLWALQRQWLRQREKTNKQTNHSATKQRKENAVCLRRQQHWMKWSLRRRRKKTNKWRTNRRAASPFFSSTFVGPLRAIKKLSEKKWKTTPTIPSNSSFHHIKLNSNKKSFIWLIWFVNEIEDCLIPFNIITVNRLHRN